MVKINPDKKFVKEFIAKLRANDNYCPCRLQRIPENKCMCKEFRDQVERQEEGYCHCGLHYYEKDK